MMPTKEDVRSTIAAVPAKTWKIVGGLLMFGLLMRLATTVSRNK
ncbi:hypothetical protein [Lacticaseibacillus jixiensis]